MREVPRFTLAGHAFWGTDPSGFCNCRDCATESPEEPEDYEEN